VRTGAQLPGHAEPSRAAADIAVVVDVAACWHQYSGSLLWAVDDEEGEVFVIRQLVCRGDT
jgi:hypothetical protein